MQVEINGEPATVEASTSIRTLVREIAGQERGVAVAIDGTVLPNTRWDELVGDVSPSTIDVLTAVQGG